ncbi:MAG: hypothetical protein H6744_10590 [Deltaproteobacteria bacterium]|nr:hypothetical protein [Deltaproteobacteria bacterium]
MVTLFDAGLTQGPTQPRDPWELRALILAFEGLIHHAHRQGSFGADERARVRGVMLPLMFRALQLDPPDPGPPEPRTG